MSFGLGFRLYLNFPGRVVLILGVCLAILGILDIVLAVTGFVQKIWGHYYATGIWCGVVVFIDGLCGILASQTRTNFAVKTFFIFSIISVLVSFVMIILSCGGLDFRSNFYNLVFSYHGKDGRATKAIHGSLLALALVEFVVSVINALLCLKSSCHDDKASIKYDKPKVKQSSLHRPPSNKDSDQSHGFRGGNPNSVPVSEDGKARRYQSPRRSHNGTRIDQEETSIDEPTETTEFLPNTFASVEKELCEKEKRRHRQNSKENDNNRDTRPNQPPTRGRMYRRQHEQTAAETKPTKINYDNQRKTQANSDKLNTAQHQTKDENQLNKWKQADELVQSHQYYYMRHSDKTGPNQIPKQELKASHIEQNTTVLEPRTTSKIISENNHADPVPRIANRHSAERSTFPKQRTNNRTVLARNNSIQEEPTRSANEQLTRNKHVKEQGTPRRPSQEQRSPTRPDQEQRAPNRPDQKQRTPNRPGKEQRAPNRPGQEQLTPTRPDQKQRTPNRPLLMIDQQPQRKEQSDKLDRKVLHHEKRNSIERSNSFKENANAEKKDNNRRLDRVVDDRYRSRLDGKQNHTPDARYNVPEVYKRTRGKEVEPLNENLRSPVIRQEPLRRSIGARGSYSDAVNLMPTVPVEKTVKEHRTVKEQTNKPPTAFGEEELPAYAEIFPNESHIYSSIESALSRPETDRINSSDHGAYSADNSLVSQSVADEEVQEILGTRMTNISNVAKTNFAREIPNIDRNAVMNPDTLQHNNASKDFAQQPASASTSQFKMPRNETAVKGRLNHKLKLHVRPKELNPDQSSSEASLALPSPLTPSPIFVRGHKTRASDLAPTSDLHDIPDINMQQSFRASFPLRKSEWDRHPRRWGISPLVKTAQHVSPRVSTSQTEKEGNALNELSSSFPLLGVLGGIDFGISDQESYLQTPDSSIYTFNFDEVKPKVFIVSPFRAQQKSSPLSVNSVPQMPSTDDEIENRQRVIETVNVGLASPPIQRHRQNHQILPIRPGTIGQAMSANVVKPKVNIASSLERQTSPHKPTYFYPPERLPSRVIDDNRTEVKQSILNHKKDSKGVLVQTSPPPLPSGSHHYSGMSPVEPQARVRLNWGSSRPEDANVAFLAFHDTLSQRNAWDRQTFPPVQPQLMGGAHGPLPRTAGRAALRQVMRSEQSAQEEPLHQRSPTDYRFHFRIPPSNITPEPSPPLTGGPPPYSSVARELPPQRSPDRAPLQPHSSGQSNSQNRSDSSRRQPVFSLVL